MPDEVTAITIDIYANILEVEANVQDSFVDLKGSMILLVDSYLQKRDTLSAEQKGELARLRGQLLTTLNHF